MGQKSGAGRTAAVALSVRRSVLPEKWAIRLSAPELKSRQGLLHS